MMVVMRHMGNSGKFAVIAGLVAAGLLILTGMTLAEPVFIAFLGVLGLACVACIGEVLRRRRMFLLVVAGLCTSLAIAGSIAFLSTWEAAFADETSLFGTPLPTSDPDNYFFLAALSLLTALAALFIGAVWPGRRGRAQHPGAARARGARTASHGSNAGRSLPRQTRSSQPRTPAGRGSQGRQPTSSALQVPQRQAPQGQVPGRQPQRRPAPRK